MVVSEETIKKIKEIIEKHYKRLAVSTLGRSVLTAEEIKQLKAQGIDVDNETSFLDLVYHHNFLNSPLSKTSPTSIQDMEAQQSAPGVKPQGAAHDYIIESLNMKTREYIDKIKEDTTSRLLGIVRENNERYRVEALLNINRDEIEDIMVKESSLGKVIQRLRDTSKDGTRDWQRVALTEMSNAIGIGSVDAIVSRNPDKTPEDTYVYRLPVRDEVTCFSENEEVYLADGTLIPLKDLKVGDILLEGNSKVGRRKKINVRPEVTFVNTVEQELFEYEFSCGTVIRCTEDHPILVKCGKFQGFVPVKDLENSVLDFTVLKFSELTTPQKVKIKKVPNWAKEVDPDADDFFYFWQKNKKWILAAFDVCENMYQFEIITGIRWYGLAEHTLRYLLKLYGRNPSDFLGTKNNNFNQEYMENRKRLRDEYLKENVEIIKTLGLEAGYIGLARELGVGRKLIRDFVQESLGSELDSEIIRNNKVRAGRRANEIIDSIPGKREELNYAARVRMIENLGKPSKPQKKLFESLNLIFGEAQLEVPILDSFNADILIGNVIVEYDGSGHFLFGAGSHQKDFVRDKLCRDAGYSVIRIEAPRDQQPNINLLEQEINNAIPGSFKRIICD